MYSSGRLNWLRRFTDLHRGAQPNKPTERAWHAQQPPLVLPQPPADRAARPQQPARTGSFDAGRLLRVPHPAGRAAHARRLDRVG